MGDFGGFHGVFVSIESIMSTPKIDLTSNSSIVEGAGTRPRLLLGAVMTGNQKQTLVGCRRFSVAESLNAINVVVVDLRQAVSPGQGAWLEPPRLAVAWRSCSLSYRA